MLYQLWRFCSYFKRRVIDRYASLSKDCLWKILCIRDPRILLRKVPNSTASLRIQNRIHKKSSERLYSSVDCDSAYVIIVDVRLLHMETLLYVRFEVLMAVKMSMLVFWIVTPCELVGRDQRFGGTYYLHLQGWRVLGKMPHRRKDTRRDRGGRALGRNRRRRLDC
jgi:hypothetical protein